MESEYKHPLPDDDYHGEHKHGEGAECPRRDDRLDLAERIIDGLLDTLAGIIHSYKQ